MSVLIMGLDMPKSCAGCIFDVFGSCLINSNIEPKNKLTHSCPLVELPDHGDLVDRDELYVNTMDYCDLEEKIWNTPAVIPAEKSEESLCICDNCDQRNDKGCSVCKYIINERSEDGET